jgi:signal transduction histidine kinase
MLNEFITLLEKRPPIESLLSRFRGVFADGDRGEPVLSEESFEDILNFLEHGEVSFQGTMVQVGVKWAQGSQRVRLRNTILKRGFVTPSCLWAYRQLRGNIDRIIRDFGNAEMGFMQILLLKESEPAESVPFLIERFLTNQEVSEEIRALSRLCILRLLDSGVSPELVRSLQARYSGVEALFQWRPGIPGQVLEPKQSPNPGIVDFHQMVRSVHDMKDFSSLTRTLYLLSSFYVPLSDKQWNSLMLSRTDHVFFRKLKSARMIEQYNGGALLTTDPARKRMVKKFLYDSYSLAKESVNKHMAVRSREEREKKVRNSELDRRALAMVSDGIICVDRSGLVFYMNPAAERTLGENLDLRHRLFGDSSLEDALKTYSPEAVRSRVAATMREAGDDTEIFGDRVTIATDGKRFEVELGDQVILMRETTDQHLIDKEIGTLYRHEMKAALDVMGAGLATARDLVSKGQVDEGAECLTQVEEKRVELFSMLEERIDFIRLHSDAFKIHPASVNLNMVVDKCVGNYREAAAARGITIRSDHLHSPGIMARGEDRFLIRALDNIIRNAVKFSEEGGEVVVELGANNLEVFVRVLDRGPGIPPESLGKIFQLGFTTSGSGRGLYLARRIALAHQGRIEVKSRPGDGSCFTMWLPPASES